MIKIMIRKNFSVENFGSLVGSLLVSDIFLIFVVFVTVTGFEKPVA